MKYWVGVASADHVKAAVAGGFVQLGHGRAGPVRRLQPGDLLALYSPRAHLQAGEIVRRFTAIGRVCDGEPYVCAQTHNVAPTRRDVVWIEARAAPIEPLLSKLSFIPSGTHWGLAFRSGLIEASEHDMRMIAEAMKARIAPL